MLEWKHTKDGQTALLIQGARRIGKSTIAQEFARNEYESHIVVDFAEAPDALWEAIKHISDRDDFFMLFNLSMESSYTNVNLSLSLMKYSDVPKPDKLLNIWSKIIDTIISKQVLYFP